MAQGGHSLVSKPGSQVGRDHSLVIFIFLTVLTETWCLPTRALVHRENIWQEVEKAQNLSAWCVWEKRRGMENG